MLILVFLPFLILESVAAYGGEAAGQGERCQLVDITIAIDGAIIAKSVIAYRGHAAGDGQAGETPAIGKGIVADSGDTRRQHKGCEVGEVGKHIVADGISCGIVAAAAVLRGGAIRVPPVVIAVAAADNLGIAEVQRLDARQVAVKVLDVGAVERARDGQLHHSGGCALCLDFLLQLTACRRSDAEGIGHCP